MNTHNPELLNSHALGMLNGEEALAVEQHLAECTACQEEWQELRATAELFESIEPAMFVDGPPLDDLGVRDPLRRALREIRAESGQPRPRFPRYLKLAAAAAAAVALAGGAAVALSTATPPPPPSVVAEGSVVGTDGPIQMTAEVAGNADSVQVTAAVQGLPPREHCMIVVAAADGTEHVAANWVTGAPEPGRSPTPVVGSVSVALDQVRSVAVRNTAGRTFITLPVQISAGG
jgi:putative zinc finger protein